MTVVDAVILELLAHLLPILAVVLLFQVGREDHCLAALVTLSGLHSVNYCRIWELLLLVVLCFVHFLDVHLQHAFLADDAEVVAVVSHMTPMLSSTIVKLSVQVDKRALSPILVLASVLQVISAINFVALEEKEDVFGVLGDVQDLVHVGSICSFNHTLHGIGDHEIAFTDHLVLCWVQVPECNQCQLFSVHAGPDVASLLLAFHQISPLFGAHSLDHIHIFMQELVEVVLVYLDLSGDSCLLLQDRFAERVFYAACHHLDQTDFLLLWLFFFLFSLSAHTFIAAATTFVVFTV